MATAESLVADLQAYTEAGATVLPNAEALECVNLALRRMQRRHDFRPMQQSTDVIIPGGTVNWTPLPLDFLHEVFLYTKDPNQSDPANALVPIAKLLKPQWFTGVSPMQNVDPTFPNVAAPSRQGVVRDLRSYYLWNGMLVIVPTPSAAITVSLDYARFFQDLVLGLVPADENLLTATYPDVVRAGALAEAYDWLHEEERAVRWTAVFQDRMKEAIDADNATAFAGPPAKRGT